MSETGANMDSAGTFIESAEETSDMMRIKHPILERMLHVCGLLSLIGVLPAAG
jgi:hypothetical protein